MSSISECIEVKLREHLPRPMLAWLAAFLGRASKARVEINRWLRTVAPEINGAVLSVGSGADSDHQGGRYREYFSSAKSYVTSDVTTERGAELELDLRNMHGVATATYDCVFCISVLEHVDDVQSALNEIHRILKPGGILLLGLPFRQAIHDAPQDFWRFTVYGVRHLLADRFDILELIEVDTDKRGWPSAYCVHTKSMT